MEDNNVVELVQKKQPQEAEYKNRIDNMLAAAGWRSGTGGIESLGICYIDGEGNIITGVEGNADFDITLMGALLSLSVKMKDRHRQD